MLPKDYECDGQISLMDYVLQNKSKEYGDRGCAVCSWNTENGCQWKGSIIYGHQFPHCPFMPDEAKVPRMCANCDHGCPFEYDMNGNKVIETPNIYCTHPEGSLNRRSDYEDIKSKNFGVGSWDRQHEWDTCDRWEIYTGEFHPDYEFEDKK